MSPPDDELPRLHPQRIGRPLPQEEFHEPQDIKLRRWILGVGLAVIPACYGILCACAGSYFIPAEKETGWYLIRIKGVPCYLLVIATLAFAGALHFHFWWKEKDQWLPSYTKAWRKGRVWRNACLLLFYLCTAAGFMVLYAMSEASE